MIIFCFLDIQEFKHELVEGKVDWKGRTALKYKHGGMRAALLVLGKFSLCLYIYIYIYIFYFKICMLINLYLISSH